MLLQKKRLGRKKETIMAMHKKANGKKKTMKKNGAKKNGNGLTAAQKKLPPALQKAIMAKKKKK
jgi:hypothetical protein